MLSNGHAGFGGRTWETDPEQSGHRAQVRPNNLCDAVEKIAAAHRTCLRPSEDEPQHQPTTDAITEPAPEELDGLRAANTRQRHAAVHDLLAKGTAVTAIADALGLDRKTIRRYANADTAEQLLIGTSRHRDSKLRPFLAHLHRRWNEGCVDAVRLHAEIRELGYRGSQRSVRRCLQPLRASGRPAPTSTRTSSTNSTGCWSAARSWTPLTAASVHSPP